MQSFINNIRASQQILSTSRFAFFYSWSRFKMCFYLGSSPHGVHFIQIKFSTNENGHSFSVRQSLQSGWVFAKVLHQNMLNGYGNWRFSSRNRQVSSTYLFTRRIPINREFQNTSNNDIDILNLKIQICIFHLK